MKRFCTHVPRTLLIDIGEEFYIAGRVPNERQLIQKYSSTSNFNETCLYVLCVSVINTNFKKVEIEAGKNASE